MRKQLFFIAGLAFLAACTNSSGDSATENTDTLAAEIVEDTIVKHVEVEEAADSNAVTFGEEIDAEGAITLEQFAQNMESNDSLEAKVVATPSKVCQKKGCWFIVELPSGEEMRIKTKGHDYLVPKNMAGKEVVFEGLAYRDTVTVKQLQHFAEDAGKSNEEIATITEPKIGISFRADGVRIL